MASLAATALHISLYSQILHTIYLGFTYDAFHPYDVYSSLDLLPSNFGIGQLLKVAKWSMRLKHILWNSTTFEHCFQLS